MIMTQQEIKDYLEQLNEILKSIDIKGEICLYGGAVMCLVYNARPSTKDVDAIFEPAPKLRSAIEKVAHANNLDEDWLNDSVKGFVVNHNQQIFFNWPNLKIYIPEPDYLLAMKTLASRVDTMDKDDIQRVFNNLPNTLYINWYGGDLVLASPNRKTTIRGDANIRGKVYQDITSDGIMKYMVNAVCGPSASILKFSNNVDSLGTITVTPSTSGKCTINFPDDISDRYWQVSAVFSTGNRGVNCSQSGVSNNQLSCTRFNSSTATEISGEIMLLVY